MASFGDRSCSIVMYIVSGNWNQFHSTRLRNSIFAPAWTTARHTWSVSRRRGGRHPAEGGGTSTKLLITKRSPMNWVLEWRALSEGSNNSGECHGSGGTDTQHNALGESGLWRLGRITTGGGEISGISWTAQTNAEWRESDPEHADN